MNVFLSLFQHLFSTPDDFKNDPRGYLSNQTGHVFLGFTLTTDYCWAASKVLGYPDQTSAFLVIVLGYLILWEITIQGWQGLDTIEDTGYLALGAGVYLFVEMQWVIDRVFYILLFTRVLLAVGTFKRWRR